VTVPAKKPKSWAIRHFSQANPEGKGQADVPVLLRRVADSIEAFGHIEVKDITFQTEITGGGPWHSLTVYFHDKRERRSALVSGDQRNTRLDRVRSEREVVPWSGSQMRPRLVSPSCGRKTRRRG
jgi:hypothetical protein